MPRVAPTSTEETVIKKTPRKSASPKKPTTVTKTPRKTAVRRVSTKTDPTTTFTSRTRVKKTTVKKVVATPEVEELVASQAEIEETADDGEVILMSTRKAPTKFAAEAASKKSKRTQYIVIGVLMIIGIGSSAIVGFSDEEARHINVAQAIKDRNDRMNNLVDVNGPVVVAPAEDLQELSAALASTTASTTASASATSTQQTIGEESAGGTAASSTLTTSEQEQGGGESTSTPSGGATVTATTTVDAIAQ